MTSLEHEAAENQAIVDAAIRAWRETGTDSSVSHFGHYWSASTLARLRGERDALAARIQ